MNISNQIKREMDKGRRRYTFLDSKEIQYIQKNIRKKYIDNKKEGVFLWEKLSEFKKKQDSELWKYISEFIGETECIVFFNVEDDSNMIRLYSGDDLKFMLEETCGYEFYITDEKYSYLICFNHHDILYACGRAIKWLELI